MKDREKPALFQFTNEFSACIMNSRLTWDRPSSTEGAYKMQAMKDTQAVSQSGSGHSSGQAKPDSGQYLTLRLGSEEYAIDILRVQEIRSYEEPTRMVNAPPFIKGVVNLRGVIVPIVDLRMKLNLSKVEYNEFTVVIILNVRGTVIGAVVDSVSDVVTLDAAAIKPAPQFETALDSRFISGLANVGERMLIVMNMDAMMSNAELGMVAALS
jgi:purine-binding chemotaxis protein CheW